MKRRTRQLAKTRSTRVTLQRHPKATLRWGRIFLVLSLFFTLSALIWQWANASYVKPSSNNPSAPMLNATAKPQPSHNRTPPKSTNIKKLPPPSRSEQTNTQTNFSIQNNGTQHASNIAVNSSPTTEVNAPFETKSLQHITHELAMNKFIGNAPKEWGEHIPGVTNLLSFSWDARKHLIKQRYGAAPQATADRVPQAKQTIALTFDACGGAKGSGYDAELITFLRENNIPATLFLTTTWMKKNALIVRDLASDPLFEIAAHGTAHKPASIDGRAAYGIKGTGSLAQLLNEVESNVRYITQATGKRPRWYRSGTAHYDDIAVTVIRKLGLGVAGFSIAGDEGATLPATQVAAKLRASQDGDIVLLHMNKPKSGTRAGLMQALPYLREQQTGFVHLSP